MSLFSSPSIPAPQPPAPEDPSVTAARQRAQAQADSSVTQSIQDDLRRRMQSRAIQFGLVPAASAPAVAPARPAVTAGFMSNGS